MMFLQPGVMNAIRLATWEKEQTSKCTTFQDWFVWASTRYLCLARLLFKLPRVNISERNWESYTALTACLQRDHKLGILSVDNILWLLSEGSDMEAFFGGANPVDRHMNPLMFASRHCNPLLVSLLLKKGARVNARNGFGETAVYCCALAYQRSGDGWGHLSGTAMTLDLLDEAGANLDAHVPRNRTLNAGFCPLAAATQSWNQLAALYLLSLNCDPDGGFDPQSQTPYPTPLSVAMNDIVKKLVLVKLLLMTGCRMGGIAEGAELRVPPSLRARLTSPHRLEDLCMARIRTSLRHGPFGAAGGGGGLGLGGFRRLELGVRGLPIPLCLKRRVLMVGLRKLIRKGQATFARTGEKFHLNNHFFVISTQMDYAPGLEDADDDTYYDKVLE